MGTSRPSPDQRPDAPREWAHRNSASLRQRGTQNQPACFSRDAFFVAHVIHVNGGIALKFVQAVNGAKINGFGVIVMACCSVSDGYFHLANWIDRHGRALLLALILRRQEVFPRAASNWQLLFLKSRTERGNPTIVRNARLIKDD